MITSSPRIVFGMLPFGSRPCVDVYFVVRLTLCLLKVISAENNDQKEEFCRFEAAVDLSNATANATGFLAESGYFFPREATRLRDGVRYGCFCDVKQCLLVCPPWDVTMIGTTRVPDYFVDHQAIPPVYTTNLTIDGDEEAPNPEERFHIVVWNPCPENLWYHLEPENYESDEFYLLKNGSLFLPQLDPELQFHKFNEYCLDLLGNGNDFIYLPRACALEEDQKDDYESAKYIGGLIALPFLLATVIVYSILPKLRNFHSTTLRCYLCCLIVTYLAFGVQQLPEPDYDTGPFCLCLGFLAYFSFLASFMWLNVMCLDMWQRFGGSKPRPIGGPRRGYRKIIRYSFYAWGIPVVLTTVCISMEFIPGVEGSALYPGFRETVCWFKTTISEGLYLYLPAGVVVATNICLFVLTALKLAQHDKNTQRRLDEGESQRHNDNKQWFRLYLKLFIVMGVTWSTEIIGWLWEGPKYVWYAFDTFNALQGILIFVFFVCKRDIWWSLKELFKKKEMKDSRLQLPGRISVSQDSSGNDLASSVSIERKKFSLYSRDSSQLTELGTLD